MVYHRDERERQPMVAVISGGPVPVVAHTTDPALSRPDAGQTAVARIAAVTPPAAMAAAADTLPRPLAYGVNGKISSHETRRTRDQRRGEPGRQEATETAEHHPGDMIDKEV